MFLTLAPQNYTNPPIPPNITQNIIYNNYNKYIIKGNTSSKNVALIYIISNDKTIDTKTYVLSKFNKEELELLNKKLEVTKNIINDFVEMDFEKLMSKYNE